MMKKLLNFILALVAILCFFSCQVVVAQIDSTAISSIDSLFIDTGMVKLDQVTSQIQLLAQFILMLATYLITQFWKGKDPKGKVNNALKAGSIAIAVAIVLWGLGANANNLFNASTAILTLVTVWKGLEKQLAMKPI